MHRYGTPGARPKAYLQAALHADEIPAMLVLHHLLQMLEQAEERGEICGEIVAVPYANPIGLTQFVNGEHLGRFALAGSGQLQPRLAGPAGRGRPSRSRTSSVPTTPRPISPWCAGRWSSRPGPTRVPRSPSSTSCVWRSPSDAADADIVFDMHCDDEALATPLRPAGAGAIRQSALAADMGCEVVLLNGPSGGDPFDEVWSTLWSRLAERFPDQPIPLACFSTTLEYRGTADVSDGLARADAEALLRYLRRRGVIAGDPGPPPATAVVAYDLNAVDVVKTPAGGILSYRVALGDSVSPGQVIADLIDPGAEDPRAARGTVVCQGGGIVLSLRAHKYVTPGASIAKIAGHESLAHRTGNLMSD